MFDTFCGFVARDIEIEKQNNYSKFEVHTDFLDTSEVIVLDKMEHKDNCKVIQGYFPDTTKFIEDKEYCFVHIYRFISIYIQWIEILLFKNK